MSTELELEPVDLTLEFVLESPEGLPPCWALVFYDYESCNRLLYYYQFDLEAEEYTVTQDGWLGDIYDVYDFLLSVASGTKFIDREALPQKLQTAIAEIENIEEMEIEE